MKVETTRFGTLDIQEDQVVTLVEGMLGFSECTRFTMLTEDLGEPFAWLQSLDDPSLAFVVVDPAKILPEYQFSVKKEKVKALEVKSVDDLQVYVIVTMAANVVDVTVNLQGPIMVNRKNRVGIQTVLNDPQFSTRHPLFTDAPENEVEFKDAITKENRLASIRFAAAG
ncbi:MAG: flagellar assembly protein FliW [Deltaproteobacteria bacterium]|nr:flagellar assembly protein FliW [Deltaproteobacteria bacterium]